LRNTEGEVLSLAVSGISKLMLLKYFYDPQILQRLVILYFHPCTINNDSLRQCLSYFLPAFSYSSIENQEFMTSILGVCIRKLLKQYYSSKKDEMITPIQIGQQMIEWTDYRRVLSNDFYKAKSCPHARLAIKFLKIAENDNITIIKTICYLLNKLTLNESVETLVIKDILERAENLKERTTNNTVNNLLSRFIYYVKSVKVKDEDEDNKSSITEFKVRVKEEINSPNNKSSHYIIKKDDISDEDEDNMETEKDKSMVISEHDNEKRNNSSSNDSKEKTKEEPIDITNNGDKDNNDNNTVLNTNNIDDHHKTENDNNDNNGDNTPDDITIVDDELLN
jgi:condensin complex subunit 3